MAVTWVKPTHSHKGKRNRATIGRKIKYITSEEKTVLEKKDATASENLISEIVDYAQNPEKIQNSTGGKGHLDNELVTGYECFPEFAAEQFSQTMERYEKTTGRRQKDNSRLVYHMRQSFKPGEVDARIANKIGYELALEFTKGEHAFVCATHTDKAHIHNHVIVCAFNLEANGKFKDPWFINQGLPRGGIHFRLE